MNWLDKCRQIIDTESGRVLLYRDEVEAVLTAGDCISRQEAISRAVEISLFGKLVKVVAVSELKALPSSQPEQIRCKDCKYWEQESICDGYCSEIEKGGFDEDHFCSYAERRTDERSD